MQILTIEDFKTMMRAEGLAFSDDEITRILPLVQAGRSLMQTVRDALPADAEPVAPVPI